MPQKSNRSKKSSCVGKLRYESEEIARLAAKIVSTKNRDYIQEYNCKYCKGWHIGHPKLFKRRK